MIYTVEMEIDGNKTVAFTRNNVKVLGRFDDKKAAMALLLCLTPSWTSIGHNVPGFSVIHAKHDSLTDVGWIGIRVTDG